MSTTANTSSITPSGVVAVVATAYIVYSTYKSTPEWLTIFREKRRKKKAAANDDLANPVVILSKLQQLHGVVKEKSSEIIIEMPWYQIHACFLSLVHLGAEIRKKHPEHRDNHYRDCGPSVKLEEAVYLREMLDYAHWAYLACYSELVDNLATRGYHVLRHDTATEPGRVGHYIAFNYTEKTCLIGLKGTSTFSDVLTDVVGSSMNHSLSDRQDIICHEGIFTAATLVADELQGFLENLVIPSNYNIIITGHSLGAGTACLLGLILKTRIPSIPLKVVAFATPAVLDYKACQACKPFTTSVVNNCDMVPRMSISNLLTLNHGLVQVNKKLQERGLSPDSLRKAYRYAADLCKLDEDTLMTAEELDALFMEIHANDSLTDDHDLYVPGKVVALFECGEGRDALEAQGMEATVGGVVAEDGTMKMLRQIELTTTMVTDHLCDSYKNNLNDLVRELS